MNRGRAAVCAGIFVLMNLGCAAERPGEDARPLPVRASEDLLPVSVLQGDLILKQRVTIRWQGRAESFDAVLQKRGDELLLLGLGPMNSVGFTLSLDDRGVRFENRSGREIPFEPERILADVQRVFYPWISATPSCMNCEQHGARAGLDVSEKIGPEMLEERRFTDSSGERTGEIVVRYTDWMDGGTIPGRAVLSNGWHGYELTVVTRSVERLE
jgi:hypothetical protein